MNNGHSISALTSMLNAIGQQRLFEFFDGVGPATAARFRAWLSTAAEAEVKAAADSLNHSSHGSEFARWWRERDSAPEERTAERSPPHLRAPDRGRSVRSGNRSARHSAIQFIALGFVLQIVGRVLVELGEGGVVLGVMLAIAGVVLYLGGCMKYAEVKGHSKWLGLVGLLSCLGLLILVLLPDRSRGMR